MPQSCLLFAVAAWLALVPLVAAKAEEAAKPVPIDEGGEGSFVRPYKSRRAPLTEQEMAIARNAWTFVGSGRFSAVPGTPVRQIFLSDPAGNGVELNFNGN